MSWLRIDDKFAEHGKVMSLSRADRWTWMELLCYCARHRRGDIPERIGELLRYVTPAFVDKCVAAGLIDRNEAGLSVHDWDVYNAASIQERVAAYLVENPEATANEVHKAIGGTRKVVLATVRDWYASGSVTGSVGGSDAGTESVTRRPARAFPSRPSTSLEGRRTEDPRTPAQAASAPNGPPLAALASYVHSYFDDYPNLDVLLDELTDRGATRAEAVAIVTAEQANRKEP